MSSASDASHLAFTEPMRYMPPMNRIAAFCRIPAPAAAPVDSYYMSAVEKG